MRITGQQGIADLFGVSRETIDNWQQQGMPVDVRGGPGVPSEYDSERCVRWLVERELGKVRTESPADRLARVKADAIEMDNAERRGQLIPADLLEPKLKAAFVAAREKFLDAVPRLARELPAELSAREAMLQGELEAFLARLADWQKAEYDEEEDE